MAKNAPLNSEPEKPKPSECEYEVVVLERPDWVSKIMVATTPKRSKAADGGAARVS